MLAGCWREAIFDEESITYRRGSVRNLLILRTGNFHPDRLLDGGECKRVSSFFHRGPEGNPKEQVHALALREYERITGFHETNPNVLWDHVLSRWGPPCEKCGKPLRTPRAKL
jgi:hypothetical protein